MGLEDLETNLLTEVTVASPCVISTFPRLVKLAVHFEESLTKEKLLPLLI